MLHKPHIIILDEPTNHLDIESVEALSPPVVPDDRAAVKEFEGEKATGPTETRNSEKHVPSQLRVVAPGADDGHSQL